MSRNKIFYYSNSQKFLIRIFVISKVENKLQYMYKCLQRLPKVFYPQSFRKTKLFSPWPLQQFTQFWYVFIRNGSCFKSFPCNQYLITLGRPLSSSSRQSGQMPYLACSSAKLHCTLLKLSQNLFRMSY